MSFGNTLPEASNLASFEEQIEFLDSETSLPIDLSSALDIIVTIARNHGNRLQGSLLNGEVTMAADFKSVTVSFTRSQMQQLLAPATYDLGIKLIFEYDVTEIQASLGFLPVVEGI